MKNFKGVLRIPADSISTNLLSFMKKLTTDFGVMISKFSSDYGGSEYKSNFFFKNTTKLTEILMIIVFYL